jgi:hypothetical protein
MRNSLVVLLNDSSHMCSGLQKYTVMVDEAAMRPGWAVRSFQPLSGGAGVAPQSLLLLQTIRWLIKDE